jgi:diguanylate cyclase (GGDEF)-like protein
MKNKPPIILIVDDTEINLHLLENLLIKEGYKVLAAGSGEQALEIVKETRPDLMLLDVGMPDMDGLSLCRKMKNIPRLQDIPIIFITARADESDIVAGFEAGGNDYITKPFTIPELQVRVRTQLALRKAHEELQKSVEKYHALAIHDDLTGLYNTRYLYQDLALEIETSREADSCLSLVFLDIDNFKNVVDNYGHLLGSQAIAEVATTIKELINEPAYGVSYGGDEFVIVLPATEKKQALEKAENIRATIAATPYLLNQKHPIHLTVSCGVATFPDDGKTIKEILGLADKSLFAIKATGKNRVGNGSLTK